MCVTAEFRPIFHRLGGLLADASSRWAAPRLQKRSLKALSASTIIGRMSSRPSLICGPFERGGGAAGFSGVVRAARGSFRLLSRPRTCLGVARRAETEAGGHVPYQGTCHAPGFSVSTQSRNVRPDFPLICPLASVMLPTGRLEIRYGRPLYGRQTPSHQRQPQGQDR